MTHYANWRHVPKEAWRWKNFSPREIACKGTGSVLVNEQALDRLQKLRGTLGIPLIVVSAYRIPEHGARWLGWGPEDTGTGKIGYIRLYLGGFRNGFSRRKV